VGRGKYGKGGALEGKERKEWVVGKLGATGVIRYIEVDSAYHVGNYPVVCVFIRFLSLSDTDPQACAIEATLCEEVSAN
jgi:allantoicase